MCVHQYSQQGEFHIPGVVVIQGGWKRYHWLGTVQ